MTRARRNAPPSPRFHLDVARPLPGELLRVGEEQVDLALALLRRRLEPEAVHDIRKATKRVRAVVRLVRDHLGDRNYRRENRAIRDAARVLSGPRDAAVLAATVHAVSERFGPEVRPSTFRWLTSVVANRRRRLATEEHVGPREAARAARMIERVRARLERWPIADDGWGTIANGIRRIYRQGRRAFAAARRAPTDANLHEWRKRAKDFRYTLELLEPLWPDVVHAWAKEADELGDALGEDHDLALLRGLVETEADGDGERPTILALLDARRGELQAVAWALGPRLYEEKPRAFVRRLGGYWRTSQRADGALHPDDANRPVLT